MQRKNGISCFLFDLIVMQCQLDLGETDPVISVALIKRASFVLKVSKFSVAYVNSKNEN
jgi:hypothetical protein